MRDLTIEECEIVSGGLTETQSFVLAAAAGTVVIAGIAAFGAEALAAEIVDIGAVEVSAINQAIQGGATVEEAFALGNQAGMEAVSNMASTISNLGNFTAALFGAAGGAIGAFDLGGGP